jgi:hypothetical protein
MCCNVRRQIWPSKGRPSWLSIDLMFWGSDWSRERVGKKPVSLDLEFSLSTSLIPVLYPCLAQYVRKVSCLERTTTTWFSRQETTVVRCVRGHKCCALERTHRFVHRWKVKSAFDFFVQDNNEGEGGEIDLGIAHVCALWKVEVIGLKGSDGWDLEFLLSTSLIPVPCPHYIRKIS